ncbi:uncharacterized protein LOC130804560 [Amaranthus tricolor]|uniref:uncharacterized protein LOC130804560 n=1 Tax=Amaranthus tricolor TaxID=29722 RepID=UPI002588EFF5|nr:uncharacterized protein LOC130804560 [Amaranthus tricolor]
MSFSAIEDDSREIRLPADVDWQMLDKSRFFFLGAALFSGVSAALYPAVVLKTRQQVNLAPIPCSRMASLMLTQEGPRSFYKGFGTSLMGTIPARALYMAALEVTKSSIGKASLRVGFSEASSATIANAVAGLSASMAAQLVWTPVDVVSQRLMVQTNGFSNYRNGFDAFKKILSVDGFRGLYRGFGISALTYAPSSAVWWGSYSVSYRLIWDGISCYKCKWKFDSVNCENGKFLEANPMFVVGVQGVSAALASGFSALITTPLDTIKTRLQVLERERGGGRGRPPTVAQTVRDLVKEGGFSACYRGLGPRWASMSMSAATMVTTYELLKRLSTKHQG